MDRRTFVLGAAGGIVALSLAAIAEQPKIYRVGVLSQGSPPPPGSKPLPGGFRMTLRDFGYIEGQNLILELRGAEDKNERLPALAVELVALRPDVIVADSTPAALAAKGATSTIPIVMVNVSDPVGVGLVASLGRPGGNITGVTDFGIETAAKQVDLLHALVPGATRVGVLMSDNPVHLLQFRAIEAAAKRVGLTMLPTMVRSPEGIETAFASIARQNAGALIWLGGAGGSSDQQLENLVGLAAKARLPALYGDRWSVEAGGLMGYGPNHARMFRTAASYVDKILKGIKPANLPVQQPTEFELVINLKTAKALGLAIPQSLLLRADVIE
jgi:putative ABC transport system substrate-binding protein